MIIHFLIKINGEERYICNQACNVTKKKGTNKKEKVTCKNCLKKISEDVKVFCWNCGEDLRVSRKEFEENDHFFCSEKCKEESPE